MMRQSLTKMWNAAPLATLILVVALAAGVYFGVRTTSNWIYWNDPAHQDQDIASWMTPGYIANSWQVPLWVVLEALDLDERPQGPPHMRAMVDLTGRSLETLSHDITANIDAFRAGTLSAPKDMP